MRRFDFSFFSYELMKKLKVFQKLKIGDLARFVLKTKKLKIWWLYKIFVSFRTLDNFLVLTIRILRAVCVVRPKPACEYWTFRNQISA
jgi:hypothetical protein